MKEPINKKLQTAFELMLNQIFVNLSTNKIEELKQEGVEELTDNLHDGQEWLIQSINCDGTICLQSSGGYFLNDLSIIDLDIKPKEGILVSESVDTEETNTIEKYARKCSVTGKGMNGGYVFPDLNFYCISREHAEEKAIEMGYKDMNEAYNENAGFWTDWNIEEEEKDGNEIYDKDGNVIYTNESLSELICSGYNPLASNIWEQMTEKQREEFIDYQYECFTDFSEAGNWENGKAPTREEVKTTTLLIFDNKL